MTTRRRNDTIQFLVLFLCISLLAPYGALAATFYVAPSGDDLNPGSALSPWATLQQAADQVIPGDTVLVADGDYGPFHVNISGTLSARITFKAAGLNANINGYELYNGRYTSISIDADYVTIDGFNIDVGAVDASILSRGIRVSGADGSHRLGVIIKNNTIQNAGWVGITTSFAEGIVIENNDVSKSFGQHGIYVANSADNPVIRGNHLHDNDEAGVQINADSYAGGDGFITNALIENNILWGNGLNGSGAIELDGVSSSTIRNNLLYSNLTTGINNYMIDGSQTSHDNSVVNNTIVMPAGSRHGIAFRNGSTGGYLRNNIIIHLGSADSIAVDATSISGLDSDYNVLTRIEDTTGDLIPVSSWQSKYGLDTHSLTATAAELFVSPSTADYSLKSTSPAVDAGVSVTGLTADILQVTRPQGARCDIGAYEFSTSAGTAVPSPPSNVKVE